MFPKLLLTAMGVRRQNPHGIRSAMHPRWTASLGVAPRANSAAIPPSSRLASPAPHRSRCSRGFIYGLLLLFTSGCSLVLVDGPPDFIPANQTVPAGACTVDRTMPFVDAIGATAGAATAVFSSEGDYVRIGLVLGGVLGYSSLSGFRKVSQCRRRMFQPASSSPPDTLFPWSSPDLILFPPGPVILPGDQSAQPRR